MELSKERLAGLLMIAGALYPGLPIFPGDGEDEEVEMDLALTDGHAPPEPGVEAEIGQPLPLEPGAEAEIGQSLPLELGVEAETGQPLPLEPGTEAELAPPPPPLRLEEEAHVTYYESEPLPYPKAGNGIELPQESGDNSLDDNVGLKGGGGIFNHMRWDEAGNGEWVLKSELIAGFG